MQKMGPLESLLKMVPGVNGKLLKQTKVDRNK
jgi:signal recognition particle GTPase